MKEIWIAGDAIVSPLGKSTAENYSNITNGLTGLSELKNSKWSKTMIMAGQIADVEVSSSLTRFESICCQAMDRLFADNDFPTSRSLFILSSTKGNISFLDEGNPEHPRLHLHATAGFLAQRYGFEDHIVVSHACISGVLAMIVARRLMQTGKYDHAVVLGADTLSHFVVSGFQSLQALSTESCRPFDSQRKGINLGEAAGAVLLTAKPSMFPDKPRIRISGAGISNDANHISGPSRTGEELCGSIDCAIREASVTPDEIDFISAHGTATLYNDEMEAKAFNLAGLQDTPLNSLKGYFGHTLGAAGVIESIISVHSLLTNTLIPTKGFSESGVSQKINVIERLVSSPLHICLKTASGFGGCNAALVWQKENE